MYTHAITVRLLAVRVSHHPFGEKGDKSLLRRLCAAPWYWVFKCWAPFESITGCNDRTVTRGLNVEPRYLSSLSSLWRMEERVQIEAEDEV
jgi:hypothetical protein